MKSAGLGGGRADHSLLLILTAGLNRACVSLTFLSISYCISEMGEEGRKKKVRERKAIGKKERK